MKSLNDIAQTQFPYCCYLTGNIPDAEDLLQDSILKLLICKQLPESNNEIEFFLRAIIKNTFLSKVAWTKAKKRQYNSFATCDVIEPVAYTKLEFKELQQNIQKLTPKRKDIFLLYMEGYKNPEIAKIVGDKRENNINCNIVYAKRNLRSMAQFP